MTKGIIVIDPGHGGTEAIGNSSPNNAISALGDLEKNFTLEIAKLVKAELIILNHSVFLTREADINLSLKDRALLAQNKNADAFVSIHFNGMTDSTIQGTETFVHSNANDDSILFASSLLARLVQATAYKNRGLKKNTFGVLSPSYHAPETAAALIEISFITEPDDALRLRDNAYKQKIAKAISLAIDDYINKRSSINKIIPTPFLELYFDTKALSVEIGV